MVCCLRMDRIFNLERSSYRLRVLLLDATPICLGVLKFYFKVFGDG